MGKALADAFPICRETFAEADAALGEPLSRLCFEGPEDQLMLTENTQPAILAVSIAAYRLLASKGIEPAFVAGHSLGEYSANVAAGTFAFADALRIVRRRGRYMQEAVPVGTGAMAAILGLDARHGRAGVRGSGAGRGREPGEPERRRAGRDRRRRATPWRAPASAPRRSGAKRVIPLPVSAPFHCALMKPAEERLAPELRALPVEDPRVPIVANVDAEPKRTAHAAIEALSRRCRRRCAGKRSCGALRRKASQRMLRWVRAPC